MKMPRTYKFIVISSLALLVVLIIQVNWIIETAEVKEEIFNEKAEIVLAKTTEALLADQETCRNIKTNVGENEMRIIDSLFNHYMKFYGLHIDYTFEVTQPYQRSVLANGFPSDDAMEQVACGQIGLEEAVNKNGFALKLDFPEKKQFIIAEMGTMFITSVILIIIVLVLSWRTILSLTKEKRISEHTTDFLNNMTHEFKTPLTNIALASKMLTKDAIIKEDKIKHYSGIILEENEKLRLQVEQVLSMTALERGEIPIQRTELDLHQLITDSIRSMNIQIENRQGDLKLDLRAEHVVVMGDKTHLTNAMCNLIDNAIKYSKEKPEIIIRTFNKDQNIVVVVSDKGIGIEKEHQKRIFDKFFRVPTGDLHDVKGFGLGLAYIKKIVDLHDGTIELESEKGKGLSSEASAKEGTTFTITLSNV